MHGVEVSGLAAAMISKAGNLASLSPVWQIAGLSSVAVVLSNLVSNVPAVMLLKPLTQSLGNDTAWLALAMSSTLAGNLTLIGSVANLIVAQQAARHREIGFMEYLRVGALITVVTVTAGVLVLAVEVRLAQGGATSSAETGTPARVVLVAPADQASAPREYRIVLVCDTPSSREQGLQGFRPLKRDEAAWFFFPKAEVVTFWMGSVSFPIDIIFVGPDKTVVRVYGDCQPGSPAYFPSTAPVRWVIETAAGSGIRAGDRVSFQ